MDRDFFLVSRLGINNGVMTVSDCCGEDTVPIYIIPRDRTETVKMDFVQFHTGEKKTLSVLIERVKGFISCDENVKLQNHSINEKFGIIAEQIITDPNSVISIRTPKFNGHALDLLKLLKFAMGDLSYTDLLLFSGEVVVFRYKDLEM